VVADVDFLDRINTAEGRRAGDAVIDAAADVLAGLCEPSDLLASLGGGRFALWLPDHSLDAATDWAEGARAKLPEAAVTSGESELHFTGSFGVAGRAPSADSAAELLRQALEALQSAKKSGRDCVARFAQFDDEAQAWEQLTAPGKLFEGTRVRDVMTPCPLVLRSNQSVAEAASLLRQTHLPALPVVDPSEKLLGLILEADVAAASASEEQLARPVAELTSGDVASYEEETRFSELMEFFKHASSHLVVVVRDGWPTGLVTLKSLAAMSEPLHRDSFAPAEPDSTPSQYLLVGDPCLVGDE
jgi:diguanylate cyclase (GGDEF)-like protein